MNKDFELNKVKLAMMKNKIFFIEKKNAMSKTKSESRMQEQIIEIMNSVEKMRLGGE